jgi:type IV pilus assembly protein PilM
MNGQWGREMADTVGIDIGASAVRAVRVSGIDSDGYAVISGFSVVPLRPDSVVSGNIRNPQAVATAIEKACKHIGTKKNVIFGASAQEAAIARLSLPSAVKPRERMDAVRTMGIQVSPAISPLDAAMAMHTLREERASDGRTTLALSLAATTQTELAIILDVAKRAKITPRAIDLLSAGTLRALVRDTEDSRESTSIVDIGATTTRVLTREGLELRAVRAFPIGGFDLTRAIASAAKETADDAERRKWSMRLPNQALQEQRTKSTYAGLEDDEDDEYIKKMNQQNVIERALAGSAEMIVEQIAQAVEVDSSGSGSRHITICGGSSLMRGLKERLHRRLGVEVRLGHPWARLERTKEHEQYFLAGREDPRVMLELVNALGLALWVES